MIYYWNYALIFLHLKDKHSLQFKNVFLALVSIHLARNPLFITNNRKLRESSGFFPRSVGLGKTRLKNWHWSKSCSAINTKENGSMLLKRCNSFHSKSVKEKLYFSSQHLSVGASLLFLLFLQYHRGNLLSIGWCYKLGQEYGEVVV